MFEERVLRNRVERFQSLMKESGIEASVIRTLSSFVYFTGIKWLRPSLIIPAEGEPRAFILKQEVEEFASKTWIRDIQPFRRVEELMRGVSGTIRERRYKVVGFDYSVERDSYVLFFELFKKMTGPAEIRDIHGLIMELRMIKDKDEIEAIKEASSIAEKGMEAAVEAVEPGATELDIAAEALRKMMKEGSENPLVHVNAGPNPRAHAEPRAWVKVKPGSTVNVVLGADYRGYHSNISRTLFVGGVSNEQRRALETIMEAHRLAERDLKPKTRLLDVEEKIKEVIEARGYGENYVAGFAHGVGLLTEEDPITTIVVPHRRYPIIENMVLAAIHAPLAIPGVGSVKCEDTFIIRSVGAEKLTSYDYEIIK